jgi:TPR repeat protein
VSDPKRSQASPRPARLKEDTVRSSNLPVEKTFCTGLAKGVRAAGWTAVLIPLLTTGTDLRGQPSEPIARAAFLTDQEQASPQARTIEQELKLAGDYLVGKGVPKDPVQSAYWFRKAADQGDPGAQNQLGYMYVWGIGVDRDDTQAFRWFSRAAGDGMQQAKLNMAVMYMKGLGVSRDPEMGRLLLTELAAKRNGRAEDYLGVIYLQGEAGPADAAAAEQWFERAAKDRNPEGEYALGQFYSVGAGHEHDFGKAAKFLREAARAGYVPVAWLERAAEAGTWQSSAALGQMAREGRGIPQNTAEAFRWFSIAVRQGGATAGENMRANLGKCRAALTVDQQDEQVRAANDWVAQHPHVDLFVFNDMRSAFPVGEVYAAKAGELP